MKHSKIWLIFFLMCAAPQVWAYCLEDSRSWEQNDVPVYVVSSGGDQIQSTGLDLNTAINYTKAAIQEWNRGSGVNLNMYYAGEVTSRTHGSDGITLYGSICITNACGPQYLGCTWGDLPDVYIAFYPTGCAANLVNWTVTPSPDAGIYDFQSVAAHELGHAIGLGHSNDNCTTSKAGTTRGIMCSWASDYTHFRWLRRDDIEAMSDI